MAIRICLPRLILISYSLRWRFCGIPPALSSDQGGQHHAVREDQDSMSGPDKVAGRGARLIWRRGRDPAPHRHGQRRSARCGMPDVGQEPIQGPGLIQDRCPPIHFMASDVLYTTNPNALAGILQSQTPALPAIVHLKASAVKPNLHGRAAIQGVDGEEVDRERMDSTDERVRNLWPRRGIV